jgi:ribosomal protein S18 acetylase RimI-like enzyme
MVELKLERVASAERGVIAYLEKDLVRNALDVWNLKFAKSRYVLHVCSIDGNPSGHAGIYHGEDAVYVTLGGASKTVEALLHLVPKKAVITVPPRLGKVVTSRLDHGAVFPNDIMLTKRGEAKLGIATGVSRLTQDRAAEYSSFGTSFNAPRAPMKWIRDRLKKSLVYGAFYGGTLVSVASLVAWLPQVAVVMGVETKEEYRRRGFGRTVVSVAVSEALRRSQTCSLFVRSDNSEAIRLYRKLGFRKCGDELWIDRGTGMIP